MEYIINNIQYLASLAGAFVVLITTLIQLKKLINNLKDVVFWSTVIFGTLLLPNGFIIWLSIEFVPLGLKSIHIIGNDFILSLVWLTSMLASVYPIFWVFFIYPGFEKLKHATNHQGANGND